MHDYRGFCRLGDECEKKHFTEIFKDSECVSIVCPKRHPRFCYFRFTFGNCKFGRECRYLHETPGFSQITPIVVEMKANIEEVTELKAEIDTLKVKIKNLEDQNKAKQSLLETINQHEKDVDILVKDIKEKDKIIEQLSEKK